MIFRVFVESVESSYCTSKGNDFHTSRPQSKSFGLGKLDWVHIYITGRGVKEDFKTELTEQPPMLYPIFSLISSMRGLIISSTLKGKLVMSTKIRHVLAKERSVFCILYIFGNLWNPSHTSSKVWRMGLFKHWSYKQLEETKHFAVSFEVSYKYSHFLSFSSKIICFLLHPLSSFFLIKIYLCI